MLLYLSIIFPKTSFSIGFLYIPTALNRQIKSFYVVNLWTFQHKIKFNTQNIIYPAAGFVHCKTDSSKNNLVYWMLPELNTALFWLFLGCYMRINVQIWTFWSRETARTTEGRSKHGGKSKHYIKIIAKSAKELMKSIAVSFHVHVHALYHHPWHLQQHLLVHSQTAIRKEIGIISRMVRMLTSAMDTSNRSKKETR